jgi:CubicO group peptidase (beta-lactamase class C family)
MSLSRYLDEQLYQFLSTYQLENDPGSHWAYSNLGVGLLGIALAHRTGMDYEALLHERITGPLGMTSTAISISPQMGNRLGTGHNAELQPLPDGMALSSRRVTPRPNLLCPAPEAEPPARGRRGENRQLGPEGRSPSAKRGGEAATDRVSARGGAEQEFVG